MKRFFLRLASLLCAAALLLAPASALGVDQALDLLERRYVDDLPDGAYRARSLDELFAALGDPYTYYMTAEQYAAFLDLVEQEESVTGLGAAVRYTDDGLLLTRILDGGGAQEAGLAAQDLITAIDGVSCVPATEAHAALLRGEEGTAVRVTVRRADGSSGDFTVIRRTVAIHNTYAALLDGHIGYLDCDSFGADTGTYFTDALARYPDADRWLVDLRGNGGGVLDSAVEAAGAFVGTGSLAYLRSRDGMLYAAPNYAPYLTEAPAVVLLDGESASAAEIFAAAIRDCSAGILIGSRSYGKGVAQIVTDAEDEPALFNGDALKLTAYRFYSVGGSSNDRVGVLPTLTVDDAYAEAVALALCAPAPQDPTGWIGLTLCGFDFFLAPGTDRAVLRALLEALPPSVPLRLGVGGAWQPTSRTLLSRNFEIDLAPRGFADTGESPCHDAVLTLAAAGLLPDEPDGLFRPGDTLTRAELCTLLASVLRCGSRDCPFADVPDGTACAGTIGALAALGLVEGGADALFRPDDALTWQEFVTVMGRLSAWLNLNAAAYLDQTDPTAPDLAAFPAWARPGAAAMTRMFVTAQDEPVSLLPHALASLDPAALVTRGEAAQTLCALLQALSLLGV